MAKRKRTKVQTMI